MNSRCRRLLIGPGAMLASACTAPGDAPYGPGQAGQWLVDLGSVQCNARPVVSFSLDRSWMLFWVEDFQPGSGMRLPLVSPALFEFDGQRLVLPAGQAERVDGPSFDPDSLCWDDFEQAVFLRSSALAGDGRRRWYRADVGGAAELVPGPPPPEHCRRPPEVELQWHREESVPADVRGDLRIVREGCCTVVLRRGDGDELARHEAQSALSDQVLISRYAWSAQGTRVAYTLSEETSWRFARPSASFVVEPPGPAQLLTGQVYAFAWRGDDELIACAGRPSAEGGGNSLKSWRFSPALP